MAKNMRPLSEPMGMNDADRFWLATVEVEGDAPKQPIYVGGFDFVRPGFARTSANFDLTASQRGGAPA